MSIYTHLMGYELPMDDEEEITEQMLRSIEFMNQVEEDFKALRADPVAWEKYSDDFEAIDGMRPT